MTNDQVQAITQLNKEMDTDKYSAYELEYELGISREILIILRDKGLLCEQTEPAFKDGPLVVMFCKSVECSENWLESALDALKEAGF